MPITDNAASLAIRTESAGDVIVKVSDATVPSQQLTVESDGSINVNASFAPGAEIKITDGTDDLAINGDGSINATVSATDLDIRDLAFATDKVDASGSSVSISGSVTVTATNLDIRDLAFATDKVDVSGSSVTATVSATDLDIRDLSHTQDSIKLGDGTDFLAINSDGSLNVKITDSSPGTAICDYNTALVAQNASSTHTYTSTGNFYLEQVECSSTGSMRCEITVNGATKFVLYGTAANRNVSLTLKQPLLATSGQTVTIVRTNYDKDSTDLHSSIMGYNA